MNISADALFERAARLPRVDVRRPDAVIGRTTVGSMQSGLFYGYVGLVEGIVAAHAPGTRRHDARCVATGGLAEMIAPDTHVDRRGGPGPDAARAPDHLGPEPGGGEVVDADAYCREIEAHLCRKNAGHLVRVVGPAFEMVAGWAARRAFRSRSPAAASTGPWSGAMAKGPGRRPLRVEFCEADVLDAFDEWRRAVGVGTAGGGATRRPEAEAAGAADEASARSRASRSARISTASSPA